MKVSEVREALKKYNYEELSHLVVEMYKAIPKKVKEDKDLDTMVKDLWRYKQRGAVKEQDIPIHFDQLRQEIDRFIEYAHEQYYVAPNSVVPKKERPKWRFTVKRFFKELQRVIPADKEEDAAVVDLMKRLYEMLCYACSSYLFNAEDPFRSVGISQVDVFDIVISRKFNSGKNEESIRFAIELMIHNDLDHETVYTNLMMQIMEHLDTDDLKKIAIEQCKVLRQELDKKKQVDLKKVRDLSRYQYRWEEKVNNLVELVYRCQIDLLEYDVAIAYFNENYQHRSKEVMLYVLLRLLLTKELKDHWVREYERAVDDGVKPREVLSKTYHYLQKNHAFPKSSYGISIF